MKNPLKKGVIVFFCLISFTSSLSQNLNHFFEKTDTFLNENVVDGKVAYKNIKASSSQLNSLIELASGVQVQKENKNQYRAFWINVYNLIVIKSVVENYPIKTPLDVAGFFDKNKHEISGKQITLNDIENKLLRGQFNNDPRFHFVLVCAGLGCPPLINEAYRPGVLETQLDRQTSLALNNPNFIKVNDKKKKVLFSQIFEWYNSDFITNDKSLIDFLNLYRDTTITRTYKSSYYSYDWNLNDIK